ncbi:MAG: hypothetical protein CMP36_01660 [Rickettsiales bacterium]|nr:hypothetical protein [Rickettsiales bacterium]OUV81689.1 MAG: hypothetical protein CBC91_02160 [Rickettsiales bacterium TMED131]
MNIKANGDLLKSKNIKYLSVPASGGDETLSAGACFASALEDYKKVKPITNPHLGEKAVLNKNLEYIKDLLNNGLGIIENFDNKKIALLLSKNHVIARCVGRAEYGARALGNRSIIANPSDANNVKKINESIKNRDFWMPFTPSILEEYSDLFLKNPKRIFSPYMTIGFNTVKKNRHFIQACLHMGDNSARPQFVSQKLNQEYWDLINEFYKLTEIPCLLNTSLNLHGEPMNYSMKDAIRTLLNSSLNFLILPNNSLLYKKEFKEFILNI